MPKLSFLSKVLVVSASLWAVGAQPLWAVDTDDIKANLALRNDVVQLFANGKADEAVGLLRRQLRVDFSDSRGEAAIAEELISEAFVLEKNSSHAASSAAADAVGKTIRGIPADGKGDRDLGRVLCDYGMVCELLLKNSADAIKYYEAGLKLSPNHPVASERLAALKQALGTK
jgi:tetratricopeptide (TPR) repeat protein